MTSGKRHERPEPLPISLELLPPILQDWHPGNPARGQCGVTALIIQDLLGGELILGRVFTEHAKVGYHYWNRLPGDVAGSMRSVDSAWRPRTRSAAEQ